MSPLEATTVVAMQEPDSRSSKSPNAACENWAFKPKKIPSCAVRFGRACCVLRTGDGFLVAKLGAADGSLKAL